MVFSVFTVEIIQNLTNDKPTVFYRSVGNRSIPRDGTERGPTHVELPRPLITPHCPRVSPHWPKRCFSGVPDVHKLTLPFHYVYRPADAASSAKSSKPLAKPEFISSFLSWADLRSSQRVPCGNPPEMGRFPGYVCIGTRVI